MSNADLCAAGEGVQDGGSRPELDGDGIVESDAPAPPALPASGAAATATVVESATPVKTTAAQARDAASVPDPPNAGGEEGCPQDPKASGLDVLIGAVDIVGAGSVDLCGNRAGPAATGDDASAQQAPTGGGNSGGGGGGGGGAACTPPTGPSSHPPSSPTDPEALGEEAPGSGRAGSKSGNREEVAHSRANPRAFAGHAPNPRTDSSAGASAGILPGFSVMTHSASAADGTALSTPATTADSWRKIRVGDGPPPPPQPRPSLGPTARDTYAELTGAAFRAAPAPAAFPGLAPKKVVHYDDDGFRLTPITVDPAHTPKPTKPKPNPAKRKAVKKTKAPKPKPKAVKAKPKTKAVKKKTVEAKSGAPRSRRGPAGQSHFKGVCLTPSGTWRAVIYVDRRQKYLGVFDNEFDAARAYDAAAVLYFPDATPPLNNPDDVERKLNAISATDGKPFATAGAPGLPEQGCGLEQGCGPRTRA